MKQKISIIAIISVSIIILICIVSLFVEVNFANPKQSYSCFSVAFDKWAMNSVDKVVFITPRKSTTITDIQLIRNLVKETKVAEMSGVGGMYNEYFIELYAGKRLVRKIAMNTLFKEVAIVYNEDSAHWIFGPHTTSDGSVELSEDLLTKIETVLNENGDYYLEDLSNG